MTSRIWSRLSARDKVLRPLENEMELILNVTQKKTLVRKIRLSRGVAPTLACFDCQWLFSRRCCLLTSAFGSFSLQTFLRCYYNVTGWRAFDILKVGSF